jgi:hypothetical protein
LVSDDRKVDGVDLKYSGTTIYLYSGINHRQGTLAIIRKTVSDKFGNCDDTFCLPMPQTHVNDFK